jgi:hypothetical protein
MATAMMSKRVVGERGEELRRHDGIETALHGGGILTDGQKVATARRGVGVDTTRREGASAGAWAYDRGVRFASLGCALVACSLLVPTLVSAQVPAPAWARSVEVIDDGAQVFGQPNRGARRRGSLALGTRLAFEARVAGTGCAAGGFVRLAPSLFVCEGDLRFSEAPPAGIAQPPMRDGDLLPYAYGFIRGDGTPSYGSPSDYFAGAYGDTFGHGFGLRIVARRTVDGVSFIQLARGSWVVADAVGVARGSQLEGIAIREGEAIDFAFTRGRETRIYASARGGRVVRRAGRREVVHVRELVGQYAALTDGTFVRTADLNRVVVTAPPRRRNG